MQETKPPPVSRPSIRRGFIFVSSLTVLMFFYLFSTNRSSNLLTIVANQYSLVEPHLLFRTVVGKLVEAGDRIVAIHEAQGSDVLSTGSYSDGSVDLKTYADTVSSDILSGIQEFFPKLPIIDEEKYATTAASLTSGKIQQESSFFRVPRLFSSHIPQDELAVYVDPLDGSLEYSQNLTEYVTVSACIVRCGVPIAGIIYQPFTQRIYWARPGSGVQVHFSPQTVIDTEMALPSGWHTTNKRPVSMESNDQCCHLPDRAVETMPETATELSQSQLQQLNKGLRTVVSRSRAQNYDEPAFSTANSIRETVLHSKEYLENMLGSPGGDPVIIPAGGAGYKVIQLLERNADIYLHPTQIRKWDVCAGEAILLENGGDLQDYFGRNIDYCVPLHAGHANEEDLLASVSVQGIVASGNTHLQRIVRDSTQKHR